MQASEAIKIQPVAPTLMAHQVEALEFLSSRPQAGLFFQMGLGKSLIMLEHLSRITHLGPFPCLIVCPLSVVSVWEREVEKFGYPYRVTKLLGTYKERVKKLEEDADIFVINYEGLRVLKDVLYMHVFRTMIQDESHRTKERTSQQTSVALDLGTRIPFRYILTGTPVTKSPEDVWTQLHFIKPGHLGNFWAFRANHIEYKTITVRAPGGYRDIKKPYRYKNLKQLEAKLGEVCLRRTKAECLDLPEKIYKVIDCPLSDEQTKHYYSLKASLVTLLGENNDDKLMVSHAATLVQKLQQICQGFIYKAEREPVYFKKNTKLEMLKDLLKDIGDERIILYTWYKAEIEQLSKELQGDDRKVLVYDGSSDERQRIVDEFQAAEGQTIFLSNIEKAKEGITLTAANHVIYYGNTYNYGSRVQSEDRAHRHGQKKNVIYYDLVCPRTVDEVVRVILRMKEKSADAITGDSLRIAKMVVEA